MKFILGKKLGMTQVFKGDNVIPVTLIESGSNFVTQIKDKDKDGYSAVQIGFGSRKEKNINKPQRGHLDKISKLLPAGDLPKGDKTPACAEASAGRQKSKLRWMREFRVDNTELKLGDEIKPDAFAVGDKVTVIAISKGKGFQGVVKRHGFHGGPKSHGQKDRLRAPGSIGASWPQHVIKGMKMAGRMGSDRKTIKNLEIIEIENDSNLIAIKGAIPGRRGTLVMIKN